MSLFQKINLSMFTSLLPFALIAGGETGNGGDIVYCVDQNKQPHAELLDIYEARKRGIVLDLGPASLTEDQKVDLALSRLHGFSETRARRYRRWASEFRAEARFERGIQLSDIPDSNHLEIPVGCEIRQIVIQINPTFKEDKRYTVDQDLWDLLNSDHKASLILHELIYREANFRFNHPDSIKARYFNSYIFSNKISELQTLDQKVEYFAKTIQMPAFDAQGIEISWLNPPKRNAAGVILEAQLAGPTEVNYKGYDFIASDHIAFYEDGALASANLPADEQILVNALQAQAPERSPLWIKNLIEFHPNGVLKQVRLARSFFLDRLDKKIEFISADQTDGLIPRGRSRSVTPDRWKYDLLFYPNGRLASGWVKTGTVVSILDRDYSIKGRLNFYNDGSIRRIYSLDDIAIDDFHGHFTIAGSRLITDRCVFDSKAFDIYLLDDPAITFFAEGGWSEFVVTRPKDSSAAKFISDHSYIELKFTEWVGTAIIQLNQRGELISSNQQISDGSYLIVDGQKINLGAERIRLFEDGSLSEGIVLSDIDFKIAGQTYRGMGWLRLLSNQELSKGNFIKPIKSVKIGSSVLDIREGFSKLKFSIQNGADLPPTYFDVYGVILDRDATFKTPKGEIFRAYEGYWVELNASGELLSAANKRGSRVVNEYPENSVQVFESEELWR